MTDLWHGLRDEARGQLNQRDYAQRSFAQRLGTSGVLAGELLAADRSNAEIANVWIPGVEFFARKIYPQRHRGYFGELARQLDGTPAQIGLWPQQWATATMFANSAKGFHVHPPHIPAGEDPARWFQRLFKEELNNYKLRPYDREQWDLMFFLQSSVEMILVDERVGMERRVMRFIIEGDDQRGANNAAVVIPPGVAHALRVEGSRDLIMVYGTSTIFNPSFEGRIASEVENAPLPTEWERYIAGS
jgi:dTDP-4-dehydrorhamnose 3,5-epimerase-like enzyme